MLVGAGDIADCSDLSGAEATAKLLEKIPGTVMAVGDLAYPDGTPENFACYDHTWGRAKAALGPLPAIMNFTPAPLPPTSNTSAPRPAIPVKVTTATNWEPGTSLC